MGANLNPGAVMLRRGRNSRIYVDKSMLVAYLNQVINTEQEYVCVSRPRRFGKTMAANMVSAYYDRTVDGKAEFAGLAIAADPSFDENRNRYDVLKLNMQEFLSAQDTVEGMVARMTTNVVWDLQDAYPNMRLRDAGNLPQVLADAYGQTGRQFVVVIDEWDCIMREKQDAHEEQRRYLDFLRALLKDKPYVALCYMTGILPIKKYGSHSALNMFAEFSMTEPFEMAAHMGFVEDEVRALCRAWDRDFAECESWYDGYRLTGIDGETYEVYGPRSVVRAMETGQFASYWNQTETFEALRRYIDLDIDGLRNKVVALTAGARMPVNIGTYVNDMATLNSADDVLTLLVHLGYLAYDSVHGEVFVPNREVAGEFANAVTAGAGNVVLAGITYDPKTKTHACAIER